MNPRNVFWASFVKVLHFLNVLWCCKCKFYGIVMKIINFFWKELGGISTSMERQKVQLQELMAVVKDMLRNTEVAVRSFMMLRPRFVHSNAGAASNAATPAQAPGATTAPSSTGQATTTAVVPVFDFYHGLPKKPSPFLQQTVARFEKYLVECRQWIEELEQLILLDSDKNLSNHGSSVVQSLPKVMENVHSFFIHVAAKVMPTTFSSEKTLKWLLFICNLYFVACTS